MTIPLVIGVNPLQTTLLQLGIVSGRVALLLRSTEIHPVLLRFVSALRGNPSLPFQGITPGRAISLPSGVAKSAAVVLFAGWVASPTLAWK
jgi:hypothetical protein